jgi:carboxyl-terminal processing protease
MKANLAITVVLLASAAPAGAELPPPSCSAVGQNIYVREVMHDLYLWRDQVRWHNPSDFASPENFLEALRVRPEDDSFSFISPLEADTAFFSESQFVGLGFGLLQTGPRELRLTEVYPDSPAADAGFHRGDTLVSVGSTSVATLIERGELDRALGPNAPGVSVLLGWRDRSGALREATLVKRVVTIPTVSGTQMFDVGGHRVGYVFFRNFVEPSFAALDQSFALLAGRVDDLVLDLRYNGGGLVSVAQYLASLVGGRRTDGQVFTSFVHNGRYRYLNEAIRFSQAPNALDLGRLIVITTRASASASELVINALRPFIPVVVVGDRTFGKPVGQYSLPFCDKVFRPVSFSTLNADGEGDYFDGIPPTCPAADDLSRDLGDPAESSLAEALFFVLNGRCRTTPRLTPSALRPSQSMAPSGWDQLLNAR